VLAEVDTEHAPCPLCGRQDGPLVVRGTDRELGLPGKFSVIRCIGCRLLRTDPRPTLDTMGSYYPESYAPYELQTASTTAKPAPSWLRSRAARIFDARDHALPPVGPGRLLELGCASGQFLEAMATRGWEVRGIEPSAAAAAHARARGLEVANVQVEKASDPEGRFDLIAAWMVLEHLHHPVRVLARLREWVAPSGWLVLSVPNAASLERKIFGRNWYALQLPRHLYHYEPSTLTQLLAGGGWEVARIIQQRTITNLVGSVGRALETTPWSRAGQRLGQAVSSSSLLRVGAFPAAAALAAVGQTGRMTVWARPIS
jgi:2-polyprenyl-3-methyl-5-hydroxy-6-metoxy-1,4-benzoquinol methylase